MLFKFAQPTHNVAVFRGAALKDAIAKGVVKGFGSLSSGRSGKALNLGSSGNINAHGLVKSVGNANFGNSRTGKAINLGTNILNNHKGKYFGNGRSGKALGLGSSSGIGNGISGVGSHRIGGLSGGHGIGGVVNGGLGIGGGISGGHGIVGQHIDRYGSNGGYDEKPDPFYFKYGVHDDKYYTDFQEERSGDEAGNIKGQYTVALPDGRIQDVVYHADGNYGGTIMEVSYKGEARHPDVIHH